MVQYPHELLNGLRHQKNTIEMYGTQIEIKAIPDEPRPGRLDPRERASAEEYRAAFRKLIEAQLQTLKANDLLFK